MIPHYSIALGVGAIMVLSPTVAGHGHMTNPPSRNGGTLAKAADCLNGECMWFSQPIAWFADPSRPIAKIPGQPTNNDAATRTYNLKINSGSLDYTATSPWRAPGAAPVFGSGCGMGGGGPYREYDGGTAKEFGLVQNMDGKDLPQLGAKTVWKRGTAVEVAWANNANHGGGYSYRLCKVTPGANVTEECFQKGHLDFSGDVQWLDRWDAAPAAVPATSAPPPPAPVQKVTRIEIPRVTVKTGTFPAGSQWARVPIPSCKYSGAKSGWPGCTADDCASCCAKIATVPPHPRINASWWRTMDCVAGCAGNGLPDHCPQGELQFPEPTPGMSSLWSSWLWCDAPRTAEDAETLAAALSVGRVGDSPHDMPCRKQQMIRTNIVDMVQLPAGLVPGDYMISWRWDSEQTNQVWQNCADVSITA